MQWFKNHANFRSINFSLNCLHIVQVNVYLRFDINNSLQIVYTYRFLALDPNVIDRADLAQRLL
jgi:hypothetical protein